MVIEGYTRGFYMVIGGYTWLYLRLYMVLIIL